MGWKGAEGGVRGQKEAEGGGKNQEWKGTEGDGRWCGRWQKAAEGMDKPLSVYSNTQCIS